MSLPALLFTTSGLKSVRSVVNLLQIHKLQISSPTFCQKKKRNNPKDEDLIASRTLTSFVSNLVTYFYHFLFSSAIVRKSIFFMPLVVTV